MTNHIRRQNRHLPSLKKHGLSAVLLLLIIMLSIYIWMQWAAKNPTTTQQAAIPLPAAMPKDTGAPQTPLPDLLAQDNIPLDGNPTQTQSVRTLDLLGGPQDNQQRQAVNTRTVTGGDGTKTILIDGRPLNDTRSDSRAQNGRRGTPLLAAPIQGLSRMSPFGPVPKIADDGRNILDVYARPFTPAANNTYIAITVGGLGIDADLTRKAIMQLPPDVTLSFAAETPNLQTWINQARQYGHEVMIELPMQGQNDLSPEDPGANYQLRADGPPSANIRNLDYLLSRAEGYFALTNYDGSKLITDTAAMGPITAHMKAAGTAFIYDGSGPDTGLVSAAKSSGLPTVTAQLLLDGSSSNPAYVGSQIKALQAEAQSGQSLPIGMGFAYAGTIEAIQNWIATKPDGIALAPVSYALKLK